MTDQTQNSNPNQDTTDAAAEAAPETPQVSQLDVLKSRARLMGITFSNNIGVDALREKINAKLESEAKTETADANAAMDSQPLAPDVTKAAAGDKPMSARDRQFREQMALVRCRITNLDPKKKDLPGEIFTVANRLLGTVRKFVPYGEATEDGYHLPRILFNELASRKFLHIRSFKNKQTGQIQVETKWVKEFSLDVLPPLTQEELDRLATAQIAAGTVQVGELG